MRHKIRTRYWFGISETNAQSNNARDLELHREDWNKERMSLERKQNEGRVRCETDYMGRYTALIQTSARVVLFQKGTGLDDLSDNCTVPPPDGSGYQSAM